MVQAVGGSDARCPDGMVYIKGGRVKYKTDETRKKPNNTYTSISSPIEKNVGPVCLDRNRVSYAFFWLVSKIFGLLEITLPTSTSDSIIESRALDFKHANRPVIDIPYSTAQKFCKLFGKRLPTEGEWALAYKRSRIEIKKAYTSDDFTPERADTTNPKTQGYVWGALVAAWDSPSFSRKPLQSTFPNAVFRCAIEPKEK